MPNPVATIDLNALVHNFNVLKAAAKNAKMMPVIKANAYGHGMVEVAKALPQADAFAVARLSEAIVLREAGVKQPLVILEGVYSVADFVDVCRHRLTPVFHCHEQLQWLEAWCDQSRVMNCAHGGNIHQNINKKLPAGAWLKIDTGMHRLGLPANQVNDYWLRMLDLVDELADCWHIGLMTHFATADGETAEAVEATRHQITTFFDVKKNLPLAQALPAAQTSPSSSNAALDVPQSLSNSAGILNYETSIADLARSNNPDATTNRWVRPGIALYGVSPTQGSNGCSLGLKPVMQYNAVISTLKNLQPNDAVGYGCTWVAKEQCRIAIVAAGYADGLPWVVGIGAFTSSAEPDYSPLDHSPYVLVNNIKCSVIGRISMDSFAILLPATLDAVEIGRPVLVWGDESLSVEDWAGWAGSIGYELVSNVSRRVHYTYLK